MIARCDHCNKEFVKVMYCSTKCRVYAHRNASVTNSNASVTKKSKAVTQSLHKKQRADRVLSEIEIIGVSTFRPSARL